MNGFAFFVGGVLPYAALAIFVVGMGYRFYVWFKTPQPGKMTLFPAPRGSLTKGVLAEVFFFPSLFRGDRSLWLMSWTFHLTLALVFLGHLRVFTGLIDQLLYRMGVSPEGVSWMSSTIGGAAGIVMVATLLLLFIRRLTSQRVREITRFSDLFALVLLLGIVVTGDMMRFAGHFDLGQTRIWAVSLLAFSPQVPQNGLFLLHALLAQLLLIYIPFSKILHFGGVFFTQALVQRR
jgi:nitrate reductase gamma subunit